MTAFSFHATMNITSAEGGALTTNNDEWADRIGMMALHGISRDGWKRYGADGYKHWERLCRHLADRVGRSVDLVITNSRK